MSPTPLENLTEMEAVLSRPDHPGQIHHACTLALAIARQAPSGCVAGLAYRVVTALNMNREPGACFEYLMALDMALRSLRYALENGNTEDVAA